MLVKRVSFNDFLEEFKKFGRENQFTYEGKKALFNYLEELGEDLGESIKLDIIGLCCDFSEYESLEEIAEEYGRDDIKTLDDLEYYTIVIEFDGGIIIQDF